MNKMESPYNLIKVKDLILTLQNNTHISFFVQRNGSQYIQYDGNTIQVLGMDVIDTLQIESIGACIQYTPEGIYPCLVVKASDSVQLIQTLNMHQIQQNLEKFKRKQEEEKHEQGNREEMDSGNSDGETGFPREYL